MWKKLRFSFYWMRHPRNHGVRGRVHVHLLWILVDINSGAWTVLESPPEYSWGDCFHIYTYCVSSHTGTEMIFNSSFWLHKVMNFSKIDGILLPEWLVMTGMLCIQFITSNAGVLRWATLWSLISYWEKIIDKYQRSHCTLLGSCCSILVDIKHLKCMLVPHAKRMVVEVIELNNIPHKVNFAFAFF